MTTIFLALHAPANSRLSADKKKRQIAGKFAGKNPVLRFDWRKWEEYDLILSDDPTHWDLTRVNNRVCPFLVNHNDDKKLGLVESVEIGDEFSFVAKLSRSQESDNYLADVEDEIAGGFSLGCNINATEVVKNAVYNSDDELIEREVRKAIEIEVFEISACNIPAFADTGVYMADNREKLLLNMGTLFKVPTRNSQPKQNKQMKESINLNEDSLKIQLSEANEKLASAIAQLTQLQSERDSLLSEVQSLTNLNSLLNQQVDDLTTDKSNADKFYRLVSLANNLKLDGKLPLPVFKSLFSITDDENPSLEKLGADVAITLNNIEFFLKQTELSAPKLNLELKAPSPQLPQLPNSVDVEKVNSDANRIVNRLTVIK